MKVDTAISAKLLGSVIKELIKKRYAEFMRNCRALKKEKPEENTRARASTMKSAALPSSANKVDKNSHR